MMLREYFRCNLLKLVLKQMKANVVAEINVNCLYVIHDYK